MGGGVEVFVGFVGVVLIDEDLGFDFEVELVGGVSVVRVVWGEVCDVDEVLVWGLVL